jgi:Kdo2-lipid IVA lauroyltransferase/acyltransferase
MNMRFQIERLLIHLFLWLVQLFPRRLVLAIGRAVGLFACLAGSRYRRVALGNVATAFPEASPAEARKLVRRCYRFFGAYLFDMLLFLNREISTSRFEEFEFEGLEHVEAAYARGKGAIFFTGHLGAWEMMAVAHGWKGYPLGVVARRLDNPHLESLLNRFRTSTGNQVIEKTQGLRPMLKILREGKGIAILIDQNAADKNRVFVDFFGKPAATTPVLGLVKMKTDAALVPVIALPLPGNRYRFVFGPEVEISGTGDREQDGLRYTETCTAIIEQQIRNHPQYWLWMHRRWKTRPENEAPDVGEEREGGPREIRPAAEVT